MGDQWGGIESTGGNQPEHNCLLTKGTGIGAKDAAFIFEKIIEIFT